MALPSPQLQRFLATGINSGGNNAKTPQPKPLPHFRHSQKTHCRCPAIAIDEPSSLSDVSGIRWGSRSLQGPREEMENDFGNPIGRSRWILLRRCF
ncbi:hypothetical protein SLA2020_460590 [Shorea laevis]